MKNQSCNTGMWVRDGYHKYHCSICFFFLFDNLYYEDKYGEDMMLKYKYCPNCGARMGVEENGNTKRN